MLSRLGPALLALLACCACGANPADKQSATARAVLAPPPPVALAAHADADHAIAAGGLQDLDKTTDRLLSTLEALPDTQRLEAETLISRPKLVEWFGFDPTKRAGWDDIGVDAAAGVFFVLDDRWPKTETTTRQIVVFVHLSQVEHWKALLTRKGAVFSQDGAVEVCEISRTTMWLTRAGEDFALTQAVAPDVPEAKAAAMEAFLAIAKTPVAPLDKAPSWKLAVHDAGRPWLAMWARTADLGAKADVDPLAFIAHCTSLFPQLAWWMGDGWAVRVTTLPLAQQGLREMFVPEKPAPACAGLIPAEGWGAARLSLHLNTLMDGVLRLLPPSATVEQRAMIAASVTGGLAMSGLPPSELMAAWNGHVCGGVDMATVPLMMSGEGLPNWLLVLGVQDGIKADAALAALADRAKNQLSMTVQPVAIGESKGFSAQIGPFSIAAVRDGERIVAAPSPEALATALARPVAQSLASTTLSEALDGRAILGLIVDLHAVREIALNLMQGRQMADETARSVSDTLGAVLGNARLTGVALRLDDASLALGPAGVAEGGWAGGTMIGMLAAIAIPQFQRYRLLAKVAEAHTNLRLIRREAMQFWESGHVDPRTDKLAAARFPQTTVVTPATSCCDPAVDRDGDQRCDADPTPWQQAGWQELGFQPDGQHSFRYRFESAGTGDGASFVASAFGDLDCDGIQSTFQVTARPCKGKACKEKFRIEEKDTAAHE